jgi:hypothetical protein
MVYSSRSGNHAKAKDMLKVRNVPRLPWPQFIVTDTEQKHIRQQRHAKGLLNTPFALPRLMLTHPQIRFEFAIALLNRPAFLVHKHKTSWRQLQQIGHQTFSMLQTHVITVELSTTVTFPKCCGSCACS